jgi:ATP-dependent Clp protease ATP-binding subunit ClpB
MLDDGWLTDSKGRRVDFRNTIIIMTSNLGTEYILGEGTEHAGDPLDDETREQIEDVLRSHFRPEFLNRIDKVVIFTPLSRDELSKVLDLQLKRVHGMAANAGFRLDITPGAREWLLDQNTQPEFGARPIRRIVQDFVQDAIVDGLTEGRFGSGDTVRAEAPPAGGKGLVLAKGEAASLPISAEEAAVTQSSLPEPDADDSGAAVELPKERRAAGGA